ncbi:hypothetical protein F4778DRAFT_46998 [Xylariomycetidae sp. FL2044]|nr:hypothetical protein F4778DRAFT_788689 [Xylariomycetidae sp. FL2044]KAH9904813.1 hypothetical protein F4778DRAFT_46998 [Xylariomycetidae sp. FL2044]
MSWSSVLVAVGAAYLAVVRLLRYKRRDRMVEQYSSRGRQSLRMLSLADAHKIVLDLATLEFPRVFSGSVFFALFKTYGIPTISSVLVTTGQLSEDSTASKRAADTGILITEVVLNPPSSARVIDGVARMNYLHGRYRKSGKITDDDMLYTLGLFALEPVRWNSMYDWRSLTDIEKCALGVFWRDLGEAMEITYDQLQPFVRLGFDDGLAWLDALQKWCDRYEESHMVPADTNRDVSKATLDIAVFNIPIRLRGVAIKAVAAMLEPRLRKAMMLDEPAPLYSHVMSVILLLRKWFVRYLCLPRPEWLRTRWFTAEKDSATGKYHPLRYIAHPWYMKPDLSSRWGFEAFTTRLYGGVLPGDEGTKYRPEGYTISELGPAALAGKGVREMNITRTKLSKRRGCPINTY